MATPAANYFYAVALLLVATTSSASVAPNQCGYDRWLVKIWADKDQANVRPLPINTTVANLVSIAIHEVPYPYDRRIAPEEFNVYRIRAKLVSVRYEQDGDTHMILEDLADPDAKMIAEIPAPECAKGTGHESDFRQAGAALSRIPKGSTIEIVGVGFFDFLHSSIGQAKNGIELHPVLNVKLSQREAIR